MKSDSSRQYPKIQPDPGFPCWSYRARVQARRRGSFLPRLITRLLGVLARSNRPPYILADRAAPFERVHRFSRVCELAQDLPAVRRSGYVGMPVERHLVSARCQGSQNFPDRAMHPAPKVYALRRRATRHRRT